MEVKTTIEIQKYGDFDMKYTDCIMVSNEKHRQKKLLKEFYDIYNIKSSSGMDSSMLDKLTEDFICFLEMKGFTKLKTYEVCFSD